MSWRDVARLEDLPQGQCRTVRVGIRRIAVWNVDGTLYAHEDACKHMKAPLSTGRLNGTTLTCSWHGWKYDVTTGECHDKSWGRVRTFPVRVSDGVIQVSDVELHPPGEDGPPDEPEEEIPRPIFRS